MPRPRAQYSGSRSLASMARPIFTYVAVVSSVLIALMFVVNPMLEKGTRAVVTSDRVGLPKPWHPDSIQTLAAAPAPAPDMTSPLVLAAQPKDQSPPEVLAKSAATDQSHEARAARAEASRTKKRVTRTQPPVEYRQNSAPPQGREFGLSGTN